MSEETKSGKEVISEFFAEIRNLEGVDEKTIEKLISLHGENKLTDIHVQNAMDGLLQEELDKMRGEKDGKD